MRLDKYLKVSRLIKRRSVANEACDCSRVTVNGRVVKPSYDVKIGDLIAVSFGTKTVTVKEKETTKKTEAIGMYEIISEANE